LDKQRVLHNSDTFVIVAFGREKLKYNCDKRDCAVGRVTLIEAEFQKLVQSM